MKILLSSFWSRIANWLSPCFFLYPSIHSITFGSSFLSLMMFSERFLCEENIISKDAVLASSLDFRFRSSCMCS